jgi:hypothetical protein
MAAVAGKLAPCLDDHPSGRPITEKGARDMAFSESASRLSLEYLPLALLLRPSRLNYEIIYIWKPCQEVHGLEMLVRWLIT